MKNLIDLDKFINELKGERKKILNRLNEINKEISAAETIKYARRSKNIIETTESVIPEYQELINTLNKKRKKRKKHRITQVGAIEEIANTIGGSDRKFKVAEVKNIMVASGFFKNPKNAYSILYTIIERSGKFEKVEPGVYKVIKKENGDKGEVK